MEAIAKYNRIRLSPRKARLVVNLVRNMNIQQALDVLHQLPHKAAPYVAKVLQSALSNLEYKQQGKKLLRKTVFIEEICVNQGKVLMRRRAAPRGNAHPIRKPTSHIVVRVGERKETPVESLQKPSRKTEKKAYDYKTRKAHTNRINNQLT